MAHERGLTRGQYIESLHEDSLNELVKQHREELDYEFFLLVSASIDAVEECLQEILAHPLL